MAKVSVTDALLKQYNDKELIRYISSKIDAALYDTSSDGMPFETALMACVTEIREVMPILRAVDKRMNGDNKGANIVV